MNIHPPTGGAVFMQNMPNVPNMPASGWTSRVVQNPQAQLEPPAQAPAPGPSSNIMAAQKQKEKDDILQLSSQARSTLKNALGSTGFKRLELLKLGQIEGLFTLLKLAQLDDDGDGIINDEEVEKYHTDGEAIIDAYKDFFINTGVVQALILSVVFPYAYEIEVEADASNAAICEYVFLHIGVSFSIPSVLTAAVMYNQLSFWLPTLETKMWYIQKIQSHLPWFEICKNLVLIFLAMALIAHHIDVNEHDVKWIVLLHAVTILASCMYVFSYLAISIRAHLFEYTKQIVGVGS